MKLTGLISRRVFTACGLPGGKVLWKYTERKYKLSLDRSRHAHVAVCAHSWPVEFQAKIFQVLCYIQTFLKVLFSFTLQANSNHHTFGIDGWRGQRCATTSNLLLIRGKDEELTVNSWEPQKGLGQVMLKSVATIHKSLFPTLSSASGPSRWREELVRKPQKFQVFLFVRVCCSANKCSCTAT